jgi:DNA methylase
MTPSTEARQAEYLAFLASKRPRSHAVGFSVSTLNPALYPHARAVTKWALSKGRAAIFAGCGLHKTGMQGVWADEVSRREQRPVMIFAPLVVADQTIRDLKRDYGLTVTFCETPADVQPGINITNYEKLDRFPDPSIFCGVVLDESSILKAHTGKYRQQLTEWASGLRYRLCCTATPAPNDYVELGTHAEFLGVMRREEMLATFFVHDGCKTSDWRLKGHAVQDFYAWIATWGLVFRKPSDIGFSDEGFELPPLEIIPIIVQSPTLEGYLFPVEAVGLTEQREAKRKSIPQRMDRVAELVNSSADQWLMFSQLNEESESVADSIPGCQEITGADSTTKKRSTLLRFLDGSLRAVSSKAKIIGFGINAQCCHNMILVGIDHSHESMYQLIRRCWRFGQKYTVRVYALFSEAERGVWNNLLRKQKQADEMAEGMIHHMEAEMKRELSEVAEALAPVKTEIITGKEYVIGLGDSVPHMWAVPDESVDYSIFSPPFASLYTYSAMENDMGNCRTPEQFFEHLGFLIPELFRILKSGRLVSFHCMNLPTSKERDGYIGIRDFRGELIKAFEFVGFIFHSEVCIWKDPVTAMQRTKALGLLHKQIKKDSSMSRQGIPDYLVTMRKPGKNDEAVAGLLEYFAGDTWEDETEFNRACRIAYEEGGEIGGRMTYEDFRSIFIWQRYASPVWMDINPSDTLQYRSAREHNDERHICPLQLQVIERGLQLWTNPGDLVFSPFAGIGSEGHEALRLKRKFLGFELKESYFRQAVKNLEYAQNHADSQGLLFNVESEDEPEAITSEVTADVE